MSKEMAFFIYLLEQYAAYRNEKTGDILREWDQMQLTQRIFDNYWGYHTERLENAFSDIDSLLGRAHGSTIKRDI